MAPAPPLEPTGRASRSSAIWTPALTRNSGQNGRTTASTPGPIAWPAPSSTSAAADAAWTALSATATSTSPTPPAASSGGRSSRRHSGSCANSDRRSSAPSSATHARRDGARGNALLHLSPAVGMPAMGLCGSKGAVRTAKHVLLSRAIWSTDTQREHKCNAPCLSFTWRYNVVIFGQCLEDVEFPNLLVGEMARMCRTGDSVVVSAPRHWDYHPHRLDRWHIMPHGMEATFRLARLQALAACRESFDCRRITSQPVFWRLLSRMILRVIIVPLCSALFGRGTAMTFLLGTYSGSSVVLTVDGMCLRRWQNRDPTVIDNYQKIYPIRGLPVAVCQHGQNLWGLTGHFNDIEAYDVLRQVVVKCRDEIIGLRVNGIAGIFQRELGPIIESTIQTEPEHNPVGLWVVGFGKGENKPEAYELFWPDKPYPVRMYDVMSGGSGNQFIERRLHQEGGDLRPKNLKTKNITYMAGCHEKIYRAAIDAQGAADPPEIGGHKHRLGISKKGCFWLIEPATSPPIEL